MNPVIEERKVPEDAIREMTLGIERYSTFTFNFNLNASLRASAAACPPSLGGEAREWAQELLASEAGVGFAPCRIRPL